MTVMTAKFSQLIWNIVKPTGCEIPSRVYQANQPKDKRGLFINLGEHYTRKVKQQTLQT